jgi:hypothetical protein
MKRVLFLLMICSVAAAVQADDELDEKLAALKKRAQRNTYSTRARLQDQNLIVPQGPTAEEEALDAKLRAMEKKLDSNSGTMLRQTAAPRVVRQTPLQTEETQNWLTPALLDNANPDDSPFEEAAPDWVTRELARQEEQKALAEEQKLVDQRLKEALQPVQEEDDNGLPGYATTLQNLIPSRSTATEEDVPQSPLSSFRRTQSVFETTAGNPRQTEPQTSSFSTRSSFPPTTDPPPQQSRFSFPARRTEELNTPSKKLSQTPKWDDLDTKPLPSRTERRRSSLFNSDPFEDDILSDPRKSIWDD